MSERTLIDYTLRGMVPHWAFGTKHADPYTPGIADLSGFVHGAGNVWIEAKSVDAWPARERTIVRLSRYTDDQKMFLVKRHGFLWLRAGREYLLFYGQNAIMLAGTVTQKELKRLSVGLWIGSVLWDQFADVIRDINPNGV